MDKKEKKPTKPEILGLAGGGTLAGLGGLAIGSGKRSIKISKLHGGKPSPDALRSITFGRGAIIGGTAIAGFSAYKHFKNKKKNDNPEK